VSFGEGMKATAEAACHAYQMSIVQLGVGAVPQSAPPSPKAAGGVAKRVVGIQHDAIHTGVTAFNQISVVGTQFVRHERENTGTTPTFSTAPAGATFSERSLGKSVEPLAEQNPCRRRRAANKRITGGLRNTGFDYGFVSVDLAGAADWFGNFHRFFLRGAARSGCRRESSSACSLFWP
jgi:hypothetical protein